MKTTKIEVRLSEAEKLNWKMQADAEGVPVSVLLRRRMKAAQDGVVQLDLDAAELSFLREELTFIGDEDTPADVASWKAFAAAQGISFPELLQRVVVKVNRSYLDAQ
jgi:hypothetical protein